VRQKRTVGRLDGLRTERPWFRHHSIEPKNRQAISDLPAKHEGVWGVKRRSVTDERVRDATMSKPKPMR
jgi:hypothetical protein